MEVSNNQRRDMVMSSGEAHTLHIRSHLIITLQCNVPFFTRPPLKSKNVARKHLNSNFCSVESLVIIEQTAPLRLGYKQRLLDNFPKQCDLGLSVTAYKWTIMHRYVKHHFMLLIPGKSHTLPSIKMEKSQWYRPQRS